MTSVDPTKTLGDRVKTVLIGKPRDLADTSIYHTLSLVAFLAWVGLGADGLSSSAYGPAEAFGTLINPDYTYLAIFLALATAITVIVISLCYSHIIEEFPTGGGGYLVASKLLGPRVGVVSGCALLVDYALTITVSIAAAGDALFGLLPPDWQFAGLTHHDAKMLAEVSVILILIVLNLRGIKESVMVLMPIFMVFLDHARDPDRRQHRAQSGRGGQHGRARYERHRKRVGRSEPRFDRDAARVPARLFVGRRHLYRNRGGFQ